MNISKVAAGMLYIPVIALVIMFIAAQAYAEFPSNDELRRTTVSLAIEGFAFASGLRLDNQGNPNGNGTELMAQRWCGSGFFVGSDGTLVTNYHVARRALRGQVIFDGGRKYDVAHLSVYDPEDDIAVLKVRSTDPFSTVSLGESNAVDVRDSVLSAGNGLCEGLALADGRIMQIQREQRRNQIARIVHTAAIAPGNSGGPLYKDDKVVGINVAGIPGYQRYYAIPVNNLRPLLDEKYKRAIHFGDVFPTDPRFIEKKFQQMFARSGRIGPASQRDPGSWGIDADLMALGDYAVSVKTPSKRPLAVGILNEAGELLAMGTSGNLERELVFLSTEHAQTVTIIVLNSSPKPIDFGLAVYQIRW